ncbi:helix-turn-helix domain-containing protein [Enterococcus faecalis]|uniref:helix-turn-helix domain-containing protein n=1 Tax=Enterococcus TaxID=1350 RepID=UPI000666B75D|nr:MULTISPECIES: helix-turn-helix domain-containing protein [Enterococcus]HAP4941431.1 helix-turn-helix domain-containing protein [Enterococcus faecalis ADL-123]EGO8292270.1 helix-turn-helix domain-containing protein [Enterococcus faecalis]EHQ2623518.1 helix-turn-helix domain-containing protein [Enterococcus faecalis]EIW2162590.1 helix-turn-helix domain-containing protein [Enterococcus faecalis]EKZ0188131.1 helix-turn-helix domain-containing protein [Enterococcus faecalis]
MKNNQRPKLSVSVILSVQQGDVISMTEVLNHYKDYINHLSLQNVYEQGKDTRIQVDEYMKRRLETKLMEAVLKYKVLD